MITIPTSLRYYFQTNISSVSRMKGHTDIRDRYLGAVLGAAVGDAVGVVREFQDVATKKEVDWAMTLPGGGPHRAGPAAVSDDTELGIQSR